MYKGNADFAVILNGCVVFGVLFLRVAFILYSSLYIVSAKHSFVEPCVVFIGIRFITCMMCFYVYLLCSECKF